MEGVSLWWYHQGCKTPFQIFFGKVTFFGISKDLNFKPLKFNMEPDNLSAPGAMNFTELGKP